MISYFPDNTNTSIGFIATYNCNQGYELVSDSGSEIRTCLDAGDGRGGVFIGQAPTCEGKQGNACAVHFFMQLYSPTAHSKIYSLQ